MSEEELYKLFEVTLHEHKKIDLASRFLDKIYKDLVFKWFSFGYHLGKQLKD